MQHKLMTAVAATAILSPATFAAVCCLPLPFFFSSSKISPQQALESASLSAQRSLFKEQLAKEYNHDRDTAFLSIWTLSGILNFALLIFGAALLPAFSCRLLKKNTSNYRSPSVLCCISSSHYAAHQTPVCFLPLLGSGSMDGALVTTSAESISPLRRGMLSNPAVNGRGHRHTEN